MESNGDDLNIEMIVEMLESDNLDDFNLARRIVYENIYTNTNQMTNLITKLKMGNKWEPYKDSNPHAQPSICRKFEVQPQPLIYFYYDYERIYR